MEIGDIARTLLGKDEHFGKVAPSRGEWVAINNGVSHIKKQLKALHKSVTEGEKLPEVIEAKQISIGFVIESSYSTSRRNRRSSGWFASCSFSPRTNRHGSISITC